MLDFFSTMIIEANSVLKILKISFQVKYPLSYKDAISIVMVQELIRFNRLIGVIRESLQNVGKAVKGLVVMTRELKDVVDSLLVGKVSYSTTQFTVLQQKITIGKYEQVHVLPSFIYGETTFVSSCLLPLMQNSSGMGSTLKGKNLLLRSKFFSIRDDPI